MNITLQLPKRIDVDCKLELETFEYHLSHLNNKIKIKYFGETGSEYTGMIYIGCLTSLENKLMAKQLSEEVREFEKECSEYIN